MAGSLLSYLYTFRLVYIRSCTHYNNYVYLIGQKVHFLIP